MVLMADAGGIEFPLLPQNIAPNATKSSRDLHTYVHHPLLSLLLLLPTLIPDPMTDPKILLE